MRRSSFFGSLVLTLALALAGCGGESDPPNGPGGTGGTGGTGGAGGIGGDAGGGGEGGGGPVVCKIPIIDYLEPAEGPVGSKVFIHGSCFGSETSKIGVGFHGSVSAALGVSQDGTVIETAVPEGVTTGSIWVSVDYGNGPVKQDGPVFTITEAKPAPLLNSISPDRVTVGASGQEIGLSGSGFVFDSKVFVNDEEIDAVYQSPTSLAVAFPASRLAVIGTYRLKVVNEPPGGGTSQLVNFFVVAPLKLLKASPIAANKIKLEFDRPVLDGAARDRRNFRIDPALLIDKSYRSNDSTSVVIIETTGNQNPGTTYAVTVGENVISAEGGALDPDSRQATFRAFGSAPLLDETYGGTGCDFATLTAPSGVRASGSRVYVVEEGGQQVQLFGLDGSNVGFLGHNGVSAGLFSGSATAVGCSDGQGSTLAGAFSSPRGAIASTGLGDVYVADTGNDRVNKYSSGGGYVGNVGTGFSSPVVLGMVGDDLWVADDSNTIRRFEVGAVGEKTALGATGAGGTEVGVFNFDTTNGGTPAMASNSEWIFVVEPGNHRVQKFAPDLGARGWIGKGHTAFSATGACCSAGTANGEFTEPTGIALDDGGNLWVLDKPGANSRIQKFADDGEFQMAMNLGYVAGGISIDRDGNIWISDRTNDQLKKYLP